MDRTSKQKINEETQILNDLLGKMDLIDIFRIFHPNAEEYTFFSSAHGTFSRFRPDLGCIITLNVNGFNAPTKSNLSKFKKIEIISSVFSDHNAETRH